MTNIREKISSKKNVLIAGALIALMVIGSTFAYFVDRDSVTNSFTVGDVEICEQCGKEYWPTRPSQKYCSKECGRAHEAFVRMNHDPAEKEGHKFFKRQCVVCGKEFWPSGPNSICCSDECRKQRISIRKKENYDAVKRAAV